MTGLRTINGKNLSSTVTRVNKISSPTWRLNTGSQVVRTNLCPNPSFEIDLSYWTINGATLDSTTSFAGTKSLKIDGGTANSYGLVDLTSGFSAGSPFTVSFQGKTPGTNVGTWVMAIQAYTANYGSVLASWTAPLPQSSTSWSRFSFTSGNVPTGTVILRVFTAWNNNGSSHPGDAWNIDTVLMEQDSVVNSYFDGSTAAANNFTYAWTGAANESASTASTANVLEVRRNIHSDPGFEGTTAGTTVLTNLLTNPSAEAAGAGWSSNNGAIYTTSYDTTTFYRGTRSVKSTVATAGPQSLSMYNVGGLPVPATPSHWYTISVYLRSDSAKAATGAVSMSFLNSVGTSVGSALSTSTAMTIGQWTKVTVSAQAPANTATIQTGATVTLTGGAAVGDFAWADSACLTEGISTENFDGSMTSPDSDFTYAWSGTANASTSTKSAVLNSSAPNRGNVYMVSSTQWKSAGMRSLRLMSQYAIGVGSGYYEFGTLGFDSWFLAGHTYTVSAVCYIDPANPKTVISGFNYSESVSSGNPVNAETDIPTSTTGQFTTSLTFTVSANATAARIRLYNGEIQGGPSIWIDQILVEEAGVALAYFDGDLASTSDNLSYSWVGTANGRQAVAKGPDFDTTTVPFKAYTPQTGVIGWQPLVGSSRILLKDSVPDSGIIGFTGVGSLSGPSISPGQFASGRVKVRQIGGSGNESLAIYLAAYDNYANFLGQMAVSGATSVPSSSGWMDVSVQSIAAAPAGASTVRFLVYSLGTLPAGTMFEFKESLIEQVSGTSVPAGSYFDGNFYESSTQSYRWAGAVDGSTSEAVTKRPISILLSDGVTWAPMSEYLKRTNLIPNPSWRITGGTVEVRRNYCIDPQITVGTNWAGVNASRGITAAAPYSPNVSATAGDTWTVSLDITAPSGSAVTGNIKVGSTVSGTFGTLSMGTPFSIPAGTTQRVSDTFALPAGADGLRLLLSSVNITDGSVTIGHALIEKASVNLPYFDGSSAAPGDGTTPSWTGAANTSASILTGPYFAGVQSPFEYYNSSPGLIGWQSAPGIQRMLAKQPITLLFGYTGATWCTANAGEYYAARVKVRQIGGAGPLSLFLRLGAYTNGGYVSNSADSGVFSLPANSDWVDVSIPSTTVMPPGSLNNRFLIYTAGSSPAGTILEFKEALVEKVSGVGITADPYFDGSMTGTRTNLCTNPSFESGTTGWSTSATYWNNPSSMSTDMTWADSGTKSLKVVGDGSQAYQGVNYIFTGSANTTYTISMTIKNDSGRPIYLGIRDNTNFINGQSSAVSPGTTARVSATVTTGSTANPSMLVGINTDGTLGASVFHIDSVLIEKSSTVGPYFDGPTISVGDYNYSWTGAVDASTSIATP